MRRAAPRLIRSSPVRARIGACTIAALAIGWTVSPAAGLDVGFWAARVLVDLRGHPLNPPQTSSSIDVFVFVSLDCPISNRYAPELKRLAAKYPAGRVRFWLVYTGTRDTADDIVRHARDYALPFSPARDPSFAFARATGVSVTPEAAVFTGGRLMYRGRIDDRHVSLSTVRPVATAHDLESAVEQAVAGRPVTLRTTIAVGCALEIRQ